MIVHVNNDTGLRIYAQFADPTDLRLQLTEGTDAKVRMYFLTDNEIETAGLAAGNWPVAIKIGEADASNADDFILDVITFRWDGESEQDAVVTVNQDSGGGILSARIGIVSITSQDYLEIVQGERKVITFIVEAHGRFVTDSFNNITVKIRDAAGIVITKEEDDNSIERVCEELDVQVFRCTLDESDTEELIDGLATIEISFDDQKARLTHSIKIIETLGIIGS